jgi:peptidoglycan/LPS O-acetylase OafA/YrhL
MGAAAVFLALRPRVTLGLAPWALVEAAALLLLVSNIALLPEIFQIGAAFGGSAAIEWLTHGPGFCFSTALFILAMALSRGPLSRLLGSKIMVYLGEISFAVYMTHYIILLAYLKHASWFSGWSGAQKLMLYIVVVLALSAGLYEFVEKPSRRLNLRLSRARNLNIIIAES